METIIGGLVVALVSGLAFIAYRHPSGYRKLYIPLMCAITAIWLIRFVYSIGYMVGFSDALVGAVTANKGSIQLPQRVEEPWWIYFLPGLALGYLAFLRSLPSILNLRDDTKA